MVVDVAVLASATSTYVSVVQSCCSESNVFVMAAVLDERSQRAH